MPIKFILAPSKLTLAFTIASLLLGCKNQFSEFMFDISKMAEHTKYFYESDGGKRISQTEITYILESGKVVDSMVITTHYKYDGKNHLTKELRQTDFEDKPEVHYYTYNSSDSLIGQITVNPTGDTTFIEKYNYYPDGRKTVFHRMLMPHLDENQDITELITKKQLDTILFKNCFSYDHSLCKLKIQYDKHDTPVEEVQYVYQGQRLVKEMHRFITNSTKRIQKIKYWDYTKSTLNPDYFSLDLHQDTVEKGINQFENESLISKTESFDYGNTTSQIYYEAGRLIGDIVIDKKMNHKATNSFRYNRKGDLVESMAYSETPNQTEMRKLRITTASSSCGYCLLKPPAFINAKLLKANNL